MGGTALVSFVFRIDYVEGDGVVLILRAANKFSAGKRHVVSNASGGFSAIVTVG